MNIEWLFLKIVEWGYKIKKQSTSQIYFPLFCFLCPVVSSMVWKTGFCAQMQLWYRRIENNLAKKSNVCLIWWITVPTRWWYTTKGTSNTGRIMGWQSSNICVTDWMNGCFKHMVNVQQTDISNINRRTGWQSSNICVSNKKNNHIKHVVNVRQTDISRTGRITGWQSSNKCVSDKMSGRFKH